ncbi:SDR family oxidoreductase [Xinfangfangia sp. CPCC 101601]|uniref:SDR family oxidoreductase n=1 Tax=Pseudogemmobacter lacusdianii TaxID=3069608 RepID=A0ABU0VZM2_9RHOB|nr:SDR family oxidoreductase [Xinfangfangia sp. CPCC 101601]MDQ2066958.1 SDR family oxidoreductase [Xinfangfangia sp. CPCC 101601]
MTQKTALITGASRGLGYALAEQLALQGWNVVALARTVGGLEALDDQVKSAKLPGAGTLTLAPMDITNEDAMRHLCRSIHDRWGGLQLWVHTAVHVTALSPAPSVDMKDLDKSIATNLRAASFMVTMVDPLLRAGNGTAMFLDDPATAQRYSATYGMTKAAQMQMARNWQAETVKTGPRVLIETPSPMATATRARHYPGEDRSPLADPRTEALRLISLL